MSSMPTRLVLAGSVLALGSVGTVSAVHLETAQVRTTPGTPLALAPATPAPPAPSLAPPATAPAPTPPPSGNTSGPTPSDGLRAPVSAKDLADLAKGPKRAVTVAVDDLERTVSDATDTDTDADTDDDSDSDPVRRIVVRGPRDDDSDQAGREFARQVIRQWAGRSTDSNRADSDRVDCRTDGGQADRGRRTGNPFQASQAWRGGSEPSWGWSASHYGAGDSMGSRDYVGRHRAE